MSVVMVIAIVLRVAAIVLDRWMRLRARWAIGLLVFAALWLPASSTPPTSRGFHFEYR